MVLGDPDEVSGNSLTVCGDSQNDTKTQYHGKHETDAFTPAVNKRPLYCLNMAVVAAMLTLILMVRGV